MSSKEFDNSHSLCINLTYVLVDQDKSKREIDELLIGFVKDAVNTGVAGHEMGLTRSCSQRNTKQITQIGDRR